MHESIHDHLRSGRKHLPPVRKLTSDHTKVVVLIGEVGPPHLVFDSPKTLRFRLVDVALNLIFVDVIVVLVDEFCQLMVFFQSRMISLDLTFLYVKILPAISGIILPEFSLQRKHSVVATPLVAWSFRGAPVAIVKTACHELLDVRIRILFCDGGSSLSALLLLAVAILLSTVIRITIGFGGNADGIVRVESFLVLPGL